MEFFKLSGRRICKNTYSVHVEVYQVQKGFICCKQTRGLKKDTWYIHGFITWWDRMQQVNKKTVYDYYGFCGEVCYITVRNSKNIIAYAYIPVYILAPAMQQWQQNTTGNIFAISTGHRGCVPWTWETRFTATWIWFKWWLNDIIQHLSCFPVCKWLLEVFTLRIANTENKGNRVMVITLLPHYTAIFISMITTEKIVCVGHPATSCFLVLVILR